MRSAAAIVATLVATSRPLFDIFSTRPVDEQERAAELPSEGVGPRARDRPARRRRRPRSRSPVAVLAIRPSWTHAGIVALGIALLLVLPSILAGALKLAERLSYGAGGRLLFVAVFELRANATRATALAATGALAIFGSVAIEGAHRDLQRGLDDFGAAYVGTADVWVSSGGDENALLTTPFAVPPALRALSTSPAVAAARLDRGGFIDIAGRRVWLIARQPSERPPIPAGEVTDGNLGDAVARLRRRRRGRRLIGTGRPPRRRCRRPASPADAERDRPTAAGGQDDEPRMVTGNAAAQRRGLQTAVAQRRRDRNGDRPQPRHQRLPRAADLSRARSLERR